MLYQGYPLVVALQHDSESLSGRLSTKGFIWSYVVMVDLHSLEHGPVFLLYRSLICLSDLCLQRY